MQKIEYDVMAAFEDGHWWYQGLRRLVVDAVCRLIQGPNPRIVDVGCGTGGCYRAVRARLTNVSYVGVDIEPVALEYCRARGLDHLVRASANDIPLRAQSADAVICLDVLYYASIRPRTALAGFYDVLKPGGVLILNLPAFESLRGEHDRAVAIPKRYRSGEIRALCEQAGFQIVRATYWNAALFFPLMIWRRLSRAKQNGEAASDVARSSGPLNGVLRWLVLAEARMARWMRFPIGSSLFVVARRPAAG